MELLCQRGAQTHLEADPSTCGLGGSVSIPDLIQRGHLCGRDTCCMAWMQRRWWQRRCLVRVSRQGWRCRGCWKEVAQCRCASGREHTAPQPGRCSAARHGELSPGCWGTAGTDPPPAPQSPSLRCWAGGCFLTGANGAPGLNHSSADEIGWFWSREQGSWCPWGEQCSWSSRCSQFQPCSSSGSAQTVP